MKNKKQTILIILISVLIILGITAFVLTTTINKTKANTECVHHMFIMAFNETEHWKECVKCGGEQIESRRSHTFGSATSNGDGTHRKKCETGCSHSKT